MTIIRFQCDSRNMTSTFRTFLIFLFIILLYSICSQHAFYLFWCNIIVPAGCLYARKTNGRKCQSGTLNHQNGRNDVLITYCTGDWLAKFGFVPACIDNCNLSYHGSAQQLCAQGQNDILVRGGLQALLKLSSSRHHGQ